MLIPQITGERTDIKVALYSDIPTDQYDTRKSNYVDFWIEATCESKNFWGNWHQNNAGNGISAIDCNYSWTAIVNAYAYQAGAAYSLTVPGYTPGNARYYYAPPGQVAYIKLDYTSGTPQNGYQLRPNGTYTPYFDPSLGYNYYIYQGIKIDRGSVFKCIPVNSKPIAILDWQKI